MIKILNIHAPIAAIFLVVSDLLVSYTSISIGLYWSYAPDNLILNLHINQYIIEKTIFISVLFFSLFSVGVYFQRFMTDMKLGFLALAISHFIALGQLALVFYVLPEYRIWISALGPGLALSFSGILITHVCFDRLVGVKLFQKKVVILGSGRPAATVQQAIDRSPYLQCIACVLVKPERNLAAIDIHDQTPSLFQFARSVGADEVVVALAERRDQTPTMELLDCRTRGIHVSDFSTFVERVDGRIEIENLKPSWMIYAEGFSGALPIQQNLKRLLDIALSLTLLVLSAPLILFAAVALTIDSEGPVFYSQTRTGLGGKNFKLWKLRSMRSDAEVDGVARWAVYRDDRITRVGAILRRLRIDELPQLYNVLRGDMSFVGPRPERPEFVEQLSREVPYYIHRHNMKPGITGWAQIHYPYGSSFEDAVEKLKYDLYYIKNGNLAVDFLVFLQTLRVIIWPNAGTGERSESVEQLDIADKAVRYSDGSS